MFVALTVFATSCTKNPLSEQNPSQGSEGKKVTLRIGATTSQISKATLSGLRVIWKEGDQISLYDGEGWTDSAPLDKDDISPDGTSATFTVSAAETDCYYAVYPASAVNKNEAVINDVISVNVPAFQTIAMEDTIDGNALVSVAKYENTELGKDLIHFEFKNVTSLAKITLPENGIETVWIESKERNEYFAGAASVNSVTPATAEGSEYRVRVDLPSDASEGQTYYASILPCTFSNGFRFIFGGENLQKAYKVSSTSQEFPVNSGLEFTTFGTLNYKASRIILDKPDLDKFHEIASTVEANYELGDNIDYEKQNWYPVSDFLGTLDGKNYSIYRIIVQEGAETTEGEVHYGFFDVLSSDTREVAKVKNLILGVDPAASRDEEDGFDGFSSVKSHDDYPFSEGKKHIYIGGIAAKTNNVKIENVECNLRTDSDKSTSTPGDVISLGGVVGIAQNTDIIGCINEHVTAITTVLAGTEGEGTNINVYVGGIVGSIDQNCNVENCISKNYEIKITKTCYPTGFSNVMLGGIVGRFANTNDNSHIKNCENYASVGATANVKSKQYFVGGIVAIDGSLSAEGTACSVEYCTNYGKVVVRGQSISSANYFGGIIGKAGNSGTLISNCDNLGSVERTTNMAVSSGIGGIVGVLSSENAQIIDCVNGDSSDPEKGRVTESGQTASQNTFHGGIVGSMSAGIVEGCTNYAKIIGGKTGDVPYTFKSMLYIGGIIGYTSTTSGSVINSCHNYGTIANYATGTPASLACGGLIGFNKCNDVICKDCSVDCALVAGAMDNSGLVFGKSGDGAAQTFGAAENKIIIASTCTVNGNAISTTSTDTYYWGKCLAGTTWGISEPDEPGTGGKRHTVYAELNP